MSETRQCMNFDMRNNQCAHTTGHSGDHLFRDREALSPSDAVSLARVTIDKYGADADKPSVKLAIALIDGAHERDSLRASLERVTVERDEMRRALAGAEGELLGLRVSEAFFRNRSEVIEKAMIGGKPTKSEAESLQGCCPMCALGDHDVCMDRARLDRLRIDDLTAERDAAIARAEAAERELRGARLAVDRVRDDLAIAVFQRDQAAATERERIAAFVHGHYDDCPNSEYAAVALGIAMAIRANAHGEKEEG